MNMKFGKKAPLISFGLNFILILLVILFLKPLLNSGDDAYLMYSLSGAFGVPPTELLDYSWGWHIFLGLPLKFLFILSPGINWYSIFLLTIHWISTSIIFLFFLKSFRLSHGLIFFSAYFIFFEATLLLSLNFSSSSIILAIAANILLIDKLNSKNLNKTSLLLPLGLLCCSGLLRFHTWAFVEVLMGIFIFFLPLKKGVYYIVFKSMLLIILVSSFIGHQHYYERNIMGWEEKEEISKILYSHYNSPQTDKPDPAVFKDSIEYDFFYNSFFYDNQILNSNRLKAITLGLKRVRNLSNQEDTLTLYWNFINGRLYFLTILLPLCFFIIKRKWDLLKKILPFLFLSFSLYCYLFFYLKITQPIFLGFIITNWLIIFLFSKNESFKSSKFSTSIFTLLSFICLVWGIIRIYKINIENGEKYNDWICYYDDLKRNSSTLHIAVNAELPIDNFYILDNPLRFSIHNFISISHFNKTVFEEKKKQFGLKNVMEDIINRSDIVLFGPKMNSLPRYYQKKFNRIPKLISDSTHYKCGNAYKVVDK